MMDRQCEYYKDQEVRVSDLDELFVGAQGGLLFVYLCFLSVFSLENGNAEGGNRFLNFDCFFVYFDQIVQEDFLGSASDTDR